MANKAQLQKLKQDVVEWNRWRQKHPQESIDLTRVADLRGVDLHDANLSGANLSGADLQLANLSGVDLSKADLRNANLSGTIFYRDDGWYRDFKGLKSSIRFGPRWYKTWHTIGANFTDANLSGANLHSADFHRADLRKADLRSANLSFAKFYDADLREADLREVKNLNKYVDFRGARFTGAHFAVEVVSVLDKVDLSGTVLRGANFSGQNLSGADLNRADLTGVDFRKANLIGTNLNGATLTDAYLWESQRTGWSIRDIFCEAVYWDKDGQERTIYKPKEFERLYATQTKIVLYYEDGISPIEVATLPAFIKHIEATHPGCVLRFQSIQEAAGGATVILAIDEDTGRNPIDLQTLKTEIETISQQAIGFQRTLLNERDLREQIQSELNIVYSKIIPRITGRAINIGAIGSVEYLSGKAEVHYPHHSLAMEVNVGDQYSNIGSGATIVSRSFVQNAFNQVKGDYSIFAGFWYGSRGVFIV